jgi:hypothetical protein
MQQTQVYSNVIDAIVCNMPWYQFELPAGTYDGFDILKNIWFPVQQAANATDPTIAMQRSMWLSPCRINGNVLESRDHSGKWWGTGMYLVRK